MKRNWNSKGYKFYDPKLKTFFESGTTSFFEDIKFGGGGGGGGGGVNKVKNFVFKKNRFIFLNRFI